jgi:hypothetical protein
MSGDEKQKPWWWNFPDDKLASWRAEQDKFESEFGDFLQVFGNASGVAASPNGALIGFQIGRPDGSSVKFSLDRGWIMLMFHAQILRALDDASERARLAAAFENVEPPRPGAMN